VTGAPSTLRWCRMRPLGDVLARAFAPSWLPGWARPALRAVFWLVLARAQYRGFVVFIPSRAVAVLKPPRHRPWLAANRLGQLARARWSISNCAAWPTGEGAGTALLAQLCRWADLSAVMLCLRASNERSAQFYRRFGFTQAGLGWHGVPMTRDGPAPVPDGTISELVQLAGRVRATEKLP
jgi:hypothetical protein